MTENISTSQILSPSDVCTLLKIKESTLRKYAILLKEAGYHFDENERGQRAYYERDVITFKKLIEIKRSSDMTLEQAAKAVVNWLEQANMTVSVINDKDKNNRYDADIKELKEMITKQNELLVTLTDRLDKQQKYIDERLNKRDEMLMQAIRESQETKKLIAAAQEEKKQPWYKKLFSQK